MRMVTALGLLSILSTPAFASFASMELQCKGLGENVSFALSSTNRPDFELKSYNSTSKDNSNEYGDINLMMGENGKSVSGKIRVISATEGQTTGVNEKEDDGSTCSIGTKTVGIEAKAVVVINGRSRTLDFACSETDNLPSAMIDCTK